MYAAHIRKKRENKQKNAAGISFLCMGFLCCCLTACIKHTAEKNGYCANGKRYFPFTVLFVLGQQFCEEASVFEYLFSVYDKKSVKDKMHVLTYSSMTQKTDSPRLKMIYEYINTIQPAVVITIGLPEGGHKYLLSAKQQYPNTIILSLLAEGDVLPLEACCNIVADFPVHSNMLQETATRLTVSETNILLLAAMLAGEQCRTMPEKTPLEHLSIAFNIAGDMLRKQRGSVVGYTAYTSEQYVDPVLNIRSYNHLLLIKKELHDDAVYQ